MDKVFYMNETLDYIFSYALEVAVFFIVGFSLIKLWEWIQKKRLNVNSFD